MTHTHAHTHTYTNKHARKRTLQSGQQAGKEIELAELKDHIAPTAALSFSGTKLMQVYLQKTLRRALCEGMRLKERVEVLQSSCIGGSVQTN